MALEAVNDWAPRVFHDAFSYLAVQRGKISNLVSDRNAWTAAYGASLWDDYCSMVPHLPKNCGAVMDVGGGMSGISILLAQHYRFPQPHFYVLDGDEDAPVVVKHSKPFNSHEIAGRFLRANGVMNFTGITPACEVRPPPPCDLIISLQSWCFHYNPETYLDYVALSARRRCVLIIDVRKTYATWRRRLESQFNFVAVIGETAKSERLVFSG